MKRILVTGGSGFIGKHVLPILIQEDWEIHSIYNSSIQPTTPQVSWYNCDLFNESQLKSLLKKIRPSHLLHLAWFSEPGKYWTSIENFHWVRSTINLLEAFHSAGGKRIVCAGTCAEYDWNYGYFRENQTPLVPATIYGRYKHILHQLVETYCLSNNLLYSWARIFYLYGPWEKSQRIIPSVINSLLNNKEIDCTNGNQIRDFLYVEDVALAFKVLVSCEEVGSFNICSGVPISIKEILLKIGQRLNGIENIKFGKIPNAVSEPAVILGDNQKLKSLGWKHTTTIDEGLDKTITWWRKIIR